MMVVGVTSLGSVGPHSMSSEAREMGRLSLV